MASMMNFSTTKWDLKIKYIVWNIPCCKCDSTTSEGMIIKPGLHTVVIIGERASDDAPKRILRLSTQRLQIFFVKYEYLPSLQLCD